MLRWIGIISDFQIMMVYASVVTLSYVVTFVVAYGFYHDPAERTEVLATLDRKIRVHYVTPVYNEKGNLPATIESMVDAAEYASHVAQVEITVVNDASTDDTAERLTPLATLPGVHIMHLSSNAGKKGAITAATYGGENWRQGYELFRLRNGRRPVRGDIEELRGDLRVAGCEPSDAEIFLHTDSDSIVGREFIYHQVVAFLSDSRIGAVSGHCDVWEGEDSNSLTRLQVAWYFTQFRVRKAAESVFGSVFCVSGPGAGFRAEAIFHLLDKWVDDPFNGRFYKGATDRMLTLLVLKDGWKTVYSQVAKVATTVPSTWAQLRSQWTRWKQNFWRMLMPVWWYAWRRNPIVAFLTYTRLIVTIGAPFILSYHLLLLLWGEYLATVFYLAGILVGGALFGLAYAAMNGKRWYMGLLRPGISLISAIWGSILTLRALWLTLRGSFVWREGAKSTKRGRVLNRWFTLPFEVGLLEVIIIIAILRILYFVIPLFM